MNSKNQTVVRQGPNLKTLDETPAEHIMKNLDAYKGYTRYDMEQLVLNPSGYTLYDGNNRNAVYKKDGAEDITLLFRNGELKDAKITSSRKPIKSSQAKLHSDNMEDVRERLENTVTQSSVETLYDGEDCFITVTQKNYSTGNESEWSFVVDFGTNKVQMLEPTEDEEGFTSDNEIYRIIKNFLNGGMSREKRMNRPDYDSGEPIKVTGKGNKIGNSRQSSMPRYNDEGKIWSDSLDEYVWEKVKYKDGDTYHWDDVNLLYWNDNGDESDYLMITTEEGLPRNCTPIKNSRKSIKSGYENEKYSQGYEDALDGKKPAMPNDKDYMAGYNDGKDSGGKPTPPKDYKPGDIDIMASRQIKSSVDDVKYDYNFFYDKLKDSPYFEEYKVRFDDDAGEDNIHTKTDVPVTITYPDGKVKDYSNCYVQFYGSGWRFIINRGWSGKEKYSDIENVSVTPNSITIKDKEGWVIDFLINNGINSSHKPIKSDFNPYYEKHPDTFVAYLVGDKDSITQEDIDKAKREWYKLFYEGYGTLYGDQGHLFIGPYSSIKAYVEDYLGLGLMDEYLHTYDYDHSVLDDFIVEPKYPLPTKKDYQDFVNQLNAFVAENYETSPKYGPLYVFNMYTDNTLKNNDGRGNEYPTIIIYDAEGNLDMHSDDSITEYIRQELEAKGWYPECVHSSSDFTIAV